MSEEGTENLGIFGFWLFLFAYSFISFWAAVTTASNFSFYFFSFAYYERICKYIEFQSKKGKEAEKTFDNPPPTPDERLST